jgi:hypothetical protein
VRKVHPRACGEHVLAMFLACIYPGSSPRVRGTRTDARKTDHVPATAAPAGPDRRSHGAYRSRLPPARCAHQEEAQSSTKHAHDPPQGMHVHVLVDPQTAAIRQRDFNRVRVTRSRTRSLQACSPATGSAEPDVMRTGVKPAGGAHLPAPIKQQAWVDPVASRDVRYPNPRLARLSDDPQLLLDAPPPPSLASGDDLHCSAGHRP